MEHKSFSDKLKYYQFPIMIVGLLLMSITAHGIIVYFATSDDAPKPEAQYYENSLKWDKALAVVEKSRALGWDVDLTVPSGPQFVQGMLRPVDLKITDRAKNPVTGLTGELFALRPANPRFNNKGTLTELPHNPGHYRTMVRLPNKGLWELNLDAHKKGVEFVHTSRIMLGGETEN